MKNIAKVQTDHIIRIIQHRAWVDFGEALLYEPLRLFFAKDDSDVLTQEQMEYASDLRREISAAEQKVSQGRERCEVYIASALITDAEAYRRVFHPEGYDERYGGFDDGREVRFCTAKWQEDKACWEERVGRFLEDLAREDEKQDKGLAPSAAPVRPQTPAVRAFYRCTHPGSNHMEIRRFAVRTA